MLNSGRSPAACQVEPAVSSARSSRTASVQPFKAKWYSVLTPTTPPPITTTRQCVFMRRSPKLKKRLSVTSAESGNTPIATITYRNATGRGAWHNSSMESPAVLRKCKYAFLTLPSYSLIAVANAIEPLRMANRLMGRDIYEWSLVSLNGRPEEASNGLVLAPTVGLDKLGQVDILFVCGGVHVREAVSPALLTALRRAADRKVALGGLCTGGYALAKAGLLDNFRATIHWENLSALREQFPRVRISDQLFTIDRDRFTCSGGTAPLDLMLPLIQMRLGPRISQLVSEQFVLDRVRKDTERQYIPLRAQIGLSHRSLIRVAQIMEENIEKPLSLDSIAKSSGISRRQIERLFKRELNCVPKRYYL